MTGRHVREQREPVRRLAALDVGTNIRLVVAEARPDGLRLRVRRRQVVFAVRAAREPAVDLWGAARKSELFARVFDLEPRFAWQGRVVVAETVKPSSRIAVRSTAHQRDDGLVSIR